MKESRLTTSAPKRAAAMLLILGGLLQTHCAPSASDLTAGTVRIDVESLSNTDDLHIVRLTLTWLGDRSVKLGGAGGNETIAVEADPDTGIAACTALIVADLVKTPAGNSVKWLHRLEGRGTRAGGPETLYDVKVDTLDTLLTIHVDAGVFPLNSPIRVAEFRDRPLWLQVGDLSKLQQAFSPQ